MIWIRHSNRSSTKTFMFCIKAKDLSTHGLMFGGKISNKGQVLMFMDTQLLACSSWLSTAALKTEPLCLPPVPTSMLIPYQLRGPWLVRILVSNTSHYSIYSLDSLALIMIRRTVVGSGMNWWNGRTRLEGERGKGQKCLLRSTSILTLDHHALSCSCWA